MRSLLLGDMVAAARALLAIPDHKRRKTIVTMLDQAHAAHAFAKRLGRPHPSWGNGSLMGRAAGMPQIPEPFASETEYLGTLGIVVDAIQRRYRPRD